MLLVLYRSETGAQQLHADLSHFCKILEMLDMAPGPVLHQAMTLLAAEHARLACLNCSIVAAYLSLGRAGDKIRFDELSSGPDFDDRALLSAVRIARGIGRSLENSTSLDLD